MGQCSSKNIEVRNWCMPYLTDGAQEALVAAFKLAYEEGSDFIRPEHLLLRLNAHPDSRRYISSSGHGSRSEDGIFEGKLMSFIETQVKGIKGSEQDPPIKTRVDLQNDKDLRNLFDRARCHQKALEDSFVDTKHLLLSFAEDRRCGKDLYEAVGLSLESLKRSVEDDRKDAEEKYEALQKYGQSLTEMARQGKLDPVIGRKEEIKNCIQILLRRTKNNAMLLGESGVGKTAIVQGLVQSIVKGDVPAEIRNCTVIALDMGALKAGASMQGEFEARIKKVSDEVSKGKFILFIDEIHMLVDGGASHRTADAANLLKPSLSHGLRCIGATTHKEYHEFIERDKALARRFTNITVHPPSETTAIFILRGLKARFELQYGYRISDSASVQAVVLSNRYLRDKNLPDKAIDLVDDAATKVKLDSERATDAIKDEVDRLGKERLQWENDTSAASQAKLNEIDSQLSACKERLERLEEQWKQEKSIMKRIESLDEQIGTINKKLAVSKRDLKRYGKLLHSRFKLEEQKEAAGKELLECRREVTENDVAEIVTVRTGIPVAKILDFQELRRLPEELQKRIIGQDEAVLSVVKAVQRSRIMGANPDKPIAVFMFMGPTGVGKTALAEALAFQLFHSEEALIRYDMSHFTEPHTVARFIGAPPGYKGFGEEGQLTDSILRRPYSVILLDEFEKADPKVFDVFLPILGDGRHTDAQERTVSLSNTIIIMTSNIGSESINTQGSGSGTLQCTQSRAIEFARKTFPPEFINRVDEWIEFKPLEEHHMRAIVSLEMTKLQKKVKEKHKITLAVSTVSIHELAKMSYNRKEGARHVGRDIQRHVEDELVSGILRGDFVEGDRILLDVDSKSTEGILPQSSFTFTKVASASGFPPEIVNASQSSRPRSEPETRKTVSRGVTLDDSSLQRRRLEVGFV